VVFNDGGVHLYAQPSTAQAQAPLLPWNTTLTVDTYLPPDAAHKDQAGWCHVTTPTGQRGYVNSGYLDYDLPDPQAKLLKIQAHDTAETIVKKAGYRLAHGRDARYYVNVLVSVNKPGTLYNPDPHPEQTDHWKKTIAVRDETIWLPGQAFADSLTGVVGSGSITGGAWATLQQGLGWAEVHVLQTASVLAQPVALVADAATGAAHYALTVGGRVMGPFVGPAVHEAAALVGGTMTVISAATSNPAAMLHALVGLATAPARVLAAIPGAFVGLLQEQGKALLGSLLGTQVRDELGDTIGAILKDPLTFARNLATAVGVGFHGLLTHLGTHFLSDALGWLVGKSGLTIPSGLGAAETMLAVAQQVVGLGEAHLTDLLVKALVKRGTSEPQARTMVRRAEGVIGTLGTVLTHLPQSAGEAGHLVTQALASLGGLVQSQIQRWLLQTMVTQAIARLVALCNPGVGLVLQAVQGIYTAVQTFLQYKDALGALLGQVVSTFRGLTTTSPAAVAAVGGKIRDLLVGLIPAALTFLMRYFGLDGLAQKIHDVLGTVRAKIDAVVGAIMERLVGLVRSVAGRISGHGAPPSNAHGQQPPHTPTAATQGEIVVTEAFAMRGEQHTLTVTLQGDDLEAIMASTPKELVARINTQIQYEEGEIAKASNATEQQRHRNIIHDLRGLLSWWGTERSSIRGATQDKHARERLVRTGANTLKAKIVDLARQYDLHSLGDFTPPPITDYDTLQAEVNSVGIINFMKGMAQHGAVGKITRQKLGVLWDQTEPKNWLKAQLRGAVDYPPHEWIPSNMILAVIDRAANLAQFSEGVKWIDLQHELRSNTNWVIFKPSFGKQPVAYQGKEYVVLQGHTGALYLDGSPQHTGQGPFHDDLRGAFEHATNTANCATRIEGVYNKWVWNGERPALPIHPQLTDGSGRNVASNLDQVIQDQEQRHSTMQQQLEAYKGTSLP